MDGLERARELVEERFALEEEKAEISGKEKAINVRIAAIDYEIKNALEAADLDEFRTKFGSVKLVEKKSFKVPKDDVSKSAFMNYLRERGVFDDLVTVNSQSLNAWANEEIEARIIEGNFNFEIPGLESPTPYTKVQIRKVKQ